MPIPFLAGLSAGTVLQLIMLISDLMIIAPIQYAKLKEAIADGTLTEEQVDALLVASEKESDDLIAAIDDL
jgi:hypothetical protein